MPVWDLEMEHRADVEGAVELPDKRGISQSVYEELGVDLFFSLWFVFLNNKGRKSCTRLFCRELDQGSRPEIMIYRVTLVVAYLGWVDYEFGKSSVCLVLLGQMGAWQNRLQGGGTFKIRVNPTKVRYH